MAKGDRWSDNQNVQVREMRNADTVLGVACHEAIHRERPKRLGVHRAFELFDGHISGIAPANAGARADRFARRSVIRMGGLADTNIELGWCRKF